MNKILLSIAAIFVCCCTINAKIKLPQQIGHNMVLQQSTNVNLWGEAKPDAVVNISSSWNSKAQVKASKDGRWKTSIPTPAASFDKRSLTISDPDGSITINNILIGEVWLCSGQSNMEMPLRGFDVSPIEGANNTIADAGNYPGIRMVTIDRKPAVTPQEYTLGEWKESNPENAPEFSATAYHFAIRLSRTMHNIPIGIIHCSWGGSRVEGWLPKEILELYKEDISMVADGNPRLNSYMTPMIMYNGLLFPLRHYTIRGFLWYQGCSNVDHHDVYAQRQADMVKHWRSLWQLGDIPFYYVEIAPYNHDRTSEGTNGALLREAQFKAQALIPNSAMITTNDLVKPYETAQVHPANKKDVGERLAFLALNKTYGYKGILADFPTYKDMEISGDRIKVNFNNAPQGFALMKGGYEGFEVAGEDKIFHPAKTVPARRGSYIMISSEHVPHPVAVRYCFRNFQTGNLTASGMPAIPFRTDNWEK
jgi:sialate O-acetylesterase